MKTIILTAAVTTTRVPLRPGIFGSFVDNAMNKSAIQLVQVWNPWRRGTDLRVGGAQASTAVVQAEAGFASPGLSTAGWDQAHGILMFGADSHWYS